jgi:hypothetical protein
VINAEASDLPRIAAGERTASSIEAWQGSGVILVSDIMHGIHTPGTIIDCYEIPGMIPEAQRLVWAFHASQLGKKYDYRGVLRFISRRSVMAAGSAPAPGADPYPDVDRWFCSQIVAQAFNYAREPLLRAPSYRVSPTMLTYSPLLKLCGRLTTGAKAE